MHGSSTAENARRAARRLGKRTTATTIVMSFLGTFGIIVPVPNAYAALSPTDEVVANGLESALRSLTGLDGLDELGDAIPFTGITPTGPSGLDLPTVFDDLADQVLAAIPTATGLGDIESVIDGVHTYGPVTVTIDSSIDSDGVTFTQFDIEHENISLPLGYLSGDPGDPATFSLDGGNLDVGVALSFDGLALEVEPSGLSVPSSAPAATLSVDVALADTSIATRLGILDVEATGSVSADIDVTIDWVDPDGSGSITQFEIENTAPLDLFDVAIGDPSPIAMDITLSSDLDGLVGVEGSVSLTHNLALGEPPAPTVNFGPTGQLGDFTNMTAGDVLASIVQLATSLRSLQLVTGNPDLPFVDQNLAEFADWTDQLTKFLVDNKLSTPANPLDVNIDPEEGSQCGNGVDDDGDTFADEGCPGQPNDLEVRGLASIEGIIAKIEAGLGLGAGALGLEYDAATRSVLFSIDKDSSFSQDPLTAKLNIADELQSAGLTSVQLEGDLSITATPSYGIHIGVGLDLSDALADPSVTPLTDRVFIQPASGDQPELFFDAPVSGNIEGTARIAMLTVTLADDNGAGDVPLLQRRSSDASSPMVSLDIAPASGDRVTLSQIFDGMSEVGLKEGTPANEFTIEVPGAFTATAAANLEVPTVRFDLEGSIGSTPLAAAYVEFSWEDVFVGTPVIEGDASFEDNFLAFDIDPDDPQALFTAILTAIDQALALVEDIGGGELDQTLPVLGTSFTDLLGWVDTIQDALVALADDPSATLDLLELSVEAAIAEALDSLTDGIDEYDLPDFPDPADPTFSPAGEFDLAAYQAAVASYLGDLETALGDATSFVTLGYEPGTSPGNLIFNLDIGVCSDDTEAGCTFVYPISTDFNFDTASLGADLAGIVAAEGEGTVNLDYAAIAHVHLGVELPTVSPGAGGPVVDGSDPVRVYLADTSGIEASLAGELINAEFGASVGPFEVQAGNTDALPETLIENACDAGDTTDDDGDGFVNDGCDPLPNPETGAECSNDTDDDGDGAINDGCEQVGATAESGAECANDTDDDAGDSDGVVNDGCDPVASPGGDAETVCDGTVDEDLDGLVNDGCAATGNALIAKAGAEFTLGNEGVTSGTGNDRFYLLNTPPGGQSIGDFFSGIVPDLGPIDGLNCDGSTDTYLACAHLPIYAELHGGTDPIFLGNIDFTWTDFGDAPNLTGADEVLDGLQAAAEAFLFDLLAQGIGALGDAIEDGVSAAAYDVSVPVIGDVLDAGAEVAEKFNTNVVDPVEDLVASLNSAGDFATIRSEISNFWWTTLDGPRSDPDTPDLLLNWDDPGAAPVQSEDIIVQLLCGAANEDCETGAGGPYSLLDLKDVSFRMAIGQQAEATTPDFDWGVPGLRLEGDATLAAEVNWRVNFGVGIGVEDGFYFLTNTDVYGGNVGDAGNDIEVSAAVDFGADTKGTDPLAGDPAALQGDLAFLSAALWNAKDTSPSTDMFDREHEVSLALGIDFYGDPGSPVADEKIRLPQLLDLLDPTEWTVNLDGYIDVNVTVATTAALGGGAGDGAIPRLLADIHLGWVLDTTAQELLDGGYSPADFQAEFVNVRLDLGSFISEFLGPVLKEVQRFTKPLQPIIDTLQAPIPGVSQLAELVGADPITLLDLMEAVSGADLTLIRRLLQVVSFVNAIPTGVNVVIPIGEFTLDQNALLGSELPSTSKDQLIGSSTVDPTAAGGGILDQLGSAGGSGFAEQVELSQGEGGFSFPAFEEPTKLFNLLVGQDVELIEFDAGKLKAEVGWSQSFGPIAIGPVPVSVVVSIGAAVEGRFVIGYDTKGIRQMIKNLTDDSSDNDGFFENVGTLFAGVYIGDLADDGSDPPEIRLTLEGSVGAAVDLVVIKAGIEAGLRATLDLNLHDGGFLNPIPPENLDGKLRIDEIITFINNPLCLFDVSGKLEAFIRIFVTLDLFLFSVTYKQTIVNITLLELENITAELCQPPEPEPASKSGGTLILNVGDRANLRNFDLPDPPGSDQDEKIVVRQISEGTTADVEVSYKGYTELYEDIDLVVGDGDGGDDTFVFEDGDISGTCQSDGSVDPPVPGYLPESGGKNCIDDDGAEEGDTITYLVNFEIKLSICGGPGKDKIGGGDNDDFLVGDGELVGSACTDNGPSGGGVDDTDTINGEGGDDEIHGNNGPDVLEGGSGDDEIWGGDLEDEIIGGIGADDLYGQDGNDGISGGPEFDPCVSDDYPDTHENDTCSDAANDYVDGGNGDDSIEGDHGRDDLNGGADNDTIVGGLGDDEINGNDGIDNLFGNEGDDVINGGNGDDDVYGGTGDDDISGGAHDDDLVGEEGADEIDGDGGRDVILGDLGVINRDPNPDVNVVSDFTPSAGKLLVELTSSTVPPAGGDDINGGADPDRIWGQDGDDQIDGDGGDDVIRGNGGDDGIRGNAGGDEIFGNDGDDTIYGDAAPGDTNPAADGVDTIRGGNGDDDISGNAKGDTLYGDSGDDTIYGDAIVEEADCADDKDFIVGGSGNDLVYGNADDDRIHGEGGTDRLIGGSDDPDVCDGSDTILGGVDDDAIAGDNATIGGGTPATYPIVLFLDGQGTGDVLFGEAGTDRVFGQQGSDDISGGGQQDFLEGNAGIDYIDGDGGDDRIVGGTSQRATVRANSDTTTVAYDVNPDTGDFLNGNDGDDVIAGDNADIAADGTTQMTASNGAGISGADVIHGNAGQDRIYGQLGSDELYGDADEDYLVGDLGFISGAPDLVLPVWPGGAPNYDVDLDSPGPETVAADDVGGGADEMYGGTGDDHMFGGTGDDVMAGNAADDYMEGNSGIDSMYGNAAGLEEADDQDDMIGGWSSWTRSALVRFDDGEQIMQGNGDHDVMLGDNGDIERVVDPDDSGLWADDEVISGARKRVVTLLDREKSEVAFPEVRGPDRMQGNDGSDRMYGEGDSDLVQGNADDDLIEGNQSGDWLEGNDGEDDIIGGTSLYASDGGIGLAGAGDDLGDPDGEDAIFGGAGADVLAGDNAIVIRKTAANSDVYDAALLGAYFTTDHTDDVPGWWLGVATDRLVILLDRTTLNDGRYGVDVVAGGSGEDVAFGQDGDDWVGGGDDDDSTEGNGGDDRMYGDLLPYTTDVITPGTEGNSTWSGDAYVSGEPQLNGVPGAAGEDDIVGGSNVTHRDGDDDIQGDGEDDFVLGDNGTLERWIVDDAYQWHEGDGPARERIFRTATQLDPGAAADTEFGDDALDGNDGDDAIWGQDGDDLIRGQDGDDDLLGELGDDTIYGGLGEDAMVGDRGSILNTELGDPDALFGTTLDVVEDYSGPPFLTGVKYFATGRYDRRVSLTLDVPGSVGGPFPYTPGDAPLLVEPGTTAGGDDMMRGGPGHDSMHGAWGDDLMNGDQGGDWMFGANGSDVMWGGYGDEAGSPELGPDYTYVDRLFGGRGGDPASDTGIITGGADVLDYRPRDASETPDGVPDPPEWHEMTGPYSDADDPTDQTGGSAVHQDHQGTDWIYGGYDRDVMQGDVTDPGPNAGDRMWDWTGAFNLYTHCDPDYGGYNDQRARSPQMELFIEMLAFDSGVGSDLADVQTVMSSAYQELALVYKFDTKDNNGKAYPTTPGHFDEIAECDIVPDVP